ncbi:type IX secretion system outer membrane channel protein PorV, partial [Capnocytophaga sp.]|uniref:type IX secretion system outer membrane channel protein PorV n=1 Tax=Capnocytophaga sp. TaxID=44737 RepID=UPI0026DBCC83
MKRLLPLLFSFFLLISYSQTAIYFPDSRIIQTGMPFLNLQSDARASAMADIGASTQPDVFSQRWNSAKYAFAESKRGLGMSYTPYLNKLTNDIFLGNITYFFRPKQRGAWGLSFNYFSMGEVEFSQIQGGSFFSEGFGKPNELTLDVSYNLLLSDNFSMGVTGRWLHSNLQYFSNDEKYVANSIAVSLSGYFQSRIVTYANFDTRWRAGITLSNIGPKLSYEKGGKDFFIPTNLKIGVGYDFIFSNDHSFSLLLEANKLLVPTPPKRGYMDSNNDGQQNENEFTTILSGKDDNVSFLEGIFQSFSDAPDGWREELQEVALSLGLEYRFRDDFALRCGYFYENPNKGARQFLTIGTGFKYQNIRFHLSYLFSMASVPNPFENALRISGSY